MSGIFGRIGSSVENLAELPGAEPDVQNARWLRRHLVSGVVGVTTVVDGLYRAATVSAAMSVSLQPPLFLISIESESQMEGWLLQSEVFGLNVLPWDQQFFADQFAGFTPLASGTFEGIAHFLSVTGAPIIEGSLAWADCRIASSFETGDHRCFVGEALALGSAKGDRSDPLVSYGSQYSRLRFG